MSYPPRFEFFLGGHDLEMVTIAALLRERAPGVPVHDGGLSWGAKASRYEPRIRAAIDAGRQPALVELADDLPDDLRAGPLAPLFVDHHGEAAGAVRPTALHQVFELLRLPPSAWTHELELVAANDRGHVKAMLDLGASMDEIRRIRSADRAAQGVTMMDEARAAEAVAAARIVAGGALTVVDSPHDRTSPIADRLDDRLGGPGFRNLVIHCPKETSFFGRGELVYELDRAFPGGWYGGALPERGFWGISPAQRAVEGWLVDRIRRLHANDAPPTVMPP